MKKIIFAISFVTMMVINANAQRDGFFGNYGDGSDGGSYGRTGDYGLATPTKPLGSTQNEDVPLGSGLLIMTAIGTAYAFRKKEKK